MPRRLQAEMGLVTPALSAPPTGKYLDFFIEIFFTKIYFLTVGRRVVAAPLLLEFAAFSRKLAMVAPYLRT